MVKKYNKDFDVWLSYITFLFHEGQAAEARVLLNRAFLSLPKTERMSCDVSLIRAQCYY